ncbi:MAG: S9 family peptidase [Acidimicrobiales bacterium]
MVQLIPRTVLFGNPERTSPRLAPDGSRLAWLAPLNGVLNVWVGPLGEGHSPLVEAVAITRDSDRGIRMFSWAHDNQHLVYLQDNGGDENWRLHDVDLAALGLGAAAGWDSSDEGPVVLSPEAISAASRDLTPYEEVAVEMIAHDRRHPDELLVGLNKDNPQLHDVYHLRLSTGELTKVLENPGMVGWVADADLVVRAGMVPQPDGGYVLMVRGAPASAPDAPASAPTAPASAPTAPATPEWRELLNVSASDALTTGPIAFSLDGSSLLALSSVGADTGRLVRIDLAGAGTEVLAEDPDSDVTDVDLDPETREPRTVSWMRERVVHRALDPALEEDLAAIASLHRGDPAVVSADDADRTWLVSFTDDAGPVAYFAYDRATRQGQMLFVHQPALSGYELAEMEPFNCTARDGLVLHGYLTFPPGEGRSGLPTVILVHGGPWARDSWGFDSEAQWLANRGYLCVQVNFRGSTGYGKSFVNAGNREWGAKMHDDLLDALAVVVEAGFADPARVAIYGGSYGGYAALVGAAFTPEAFRCAVDLVGPSNLKTLIETIPPYWVPLVAQFHTRVGDPSTEEEFLWSRSPLSRAADIRIPMLIAQGANDPRVKQSEAEQIVDALSAAGVEHEYLLFPDEGHGFAKPENRMRFYGATEAFLSRHLGGRAEP